MIAAMKKSTGRDANVWLQRLVVFVFSILAVSFRVSAEENERSGADWVAELEAAHAKLGGFIAAYSFESENRRMEATLAVDKESGLSALRLLAEIVGEPVTDVKHWVTADDVVYVDIEGERKKITEPRKIISRMMSDLSELLQLVDKKGELEIGLGFESAVWQPMFLFGEDNGIHTGFGISTVSAPFWKSAAEDAAVQGYDKDTVTFRTKEHGLLTVSRGHGLLLRQSVKDKEGDDRVLELAELVENPGRDKVRELTADWPTAGAEEMVAKDMLAGMSGSIRAKFFQEIVGAVSAGKIHPGELAAWLAAQRGRLREMLAPWVREGRPYLEGDGMWDGLLAEAKGVLEDDLWDKGVDLRGGAEVNRLLHSPAARNRLRAATVQALAEEPGVLDRVSDEIFMGQRLEAADEAGITARDVILEGLAEAYLDAVFDRKARQAWGELEE
jgi:hypothetical protein